MDIANLLLRITGDDEDAKRSLREVAAEIQAFAQKDAEAELKVGGVELAMTQIKRLETALDIVGSRDVTAHVKVEVDSARAKLAILRKELEHALSGGSGARGVGTILADIGEVGSIINTLGQGAGTMAKVGQGVEQVGVQVGGLLTSLPLVGGMFAAIGALSLPVLAAMAVAVVFLVGAIGSLVIALTAVIAALISAAAGFGILAGAALLLLGPLVAVLIPAMIEFVKVIKAATVSQDELKQRHEDTTKAQQRQADASKALAEAHRNVGEQSKAAYDAWAEAIERVDDDLRAIEGAKLGQTQADINLERAKQHLKELRGAAKEAGPEFDRLFNRMENVSHLSPSGLAKAERGIGALRTGTDSSKLDLKQALLDVAQAQLGVKNADDALSDSHKKLATDQETVNKFTREGIKAYDPYRQSLKQVTDAQNQLKDATDAVEKSRKAETKEIDAVGKKNRGLIADVRGFVKDLKDFFQPVISEVFKGIGSAMDSLRKSLPHFQSSFRGLGSAIGDSIAQFARALTDPRTQRNLNGLITAAGRFVREATPGMIALFNIILDIANVAFPTVLKHVRNFSRGLSNTAGDGEKMEGIRRVVRRLIGAFEDAWGLAKSVGRAIWHIVDAGSPMGRGLLRSVTRLVDKFNKFAESKKGREEIQQWFRDALPMAKHLVHEFGRFVDLLDKMVGFGEKLEPLLTILDKILGAAGKALDKLMGVGEWIGSHGPSGTLKSNKESDETVKNAVRLLNDPRTSPQVKEQMKKIIEEGRLASGGIATRATFRVFGEAGPEAVVPLTNAVLSSIGQGAVAALREEGGMRKLGAAGAGGLGGVNHFNDIKITAPAGKLPDARHTAIALSRELSRRGGGSLVG